MASRALQINFSSNLKKFETRKKRKSENQNCTFSGIKRLDRDKEDVDASKSLSRVEMWHRALSVAHTPSPMQCVLLNEEIDLYGRTNVRPLINLEPEEEQ